MRNGTQQLKNNSNSIMLGINSNTNTPNSTPTSDLLRSFSSSPNNTSTSQNANLIQSLINLSNSTNKLLHRSDSFSLNLSSSPLLLSTKADNEMHFNSFDDVDNEIIEHTLKNSSEKKATASADATNEHSLKIKKSKVMRLSSNDFGANDDEIYNNNSEILTSSDMPKTMSAVKTPKSALLEKRRRAVHELLIHNLYPSGKAHYLLFGLQRRFTNGVLTS